MSAAPAPFGAGVDLVKSELLHRIKDAETAADERVAQAEAEAKQIRADARREAESIQAQGRDTAESTAQDLLATARSEAEATAETTVEAGLKKAKRLRASFEESAGDATGRVLKLFEERL